jgi:copper chaperone
MWHYEGTVIGMTCAHCAVAVTEAVSALAGVRSADVDLAARRLRVDFDEPIEMNDLRETVAAAGYELVPSAVPERDVAGGQQ